MPINTNYYGDYYRRNDYATQNRFNNVLPQNNVNIISNQTDIFKSSNSSTCKDGKDDGSIGFWEATKNVLKGGVKFFTGMFTDENGDFSWKQTFKTIGMGVAIGLATMIPVVGPLVLPALCTYGMLHGGKEVLSGISNAINARTDAEAEQAWQEVGSGATEGALSYVGYKATGGFKKAWAKTKADYAALKTNVNTKPTSSVSETDVSNKSSVEEPTNPAEAKPKAEVEVEAKAKAEAEAKAKAESEAKAKAEAEAKAKAEAEAKVKAEAEAKAKAEAEAKAKAEAEAKAKAEAEAKAKAEAEAKAKAEAEAKAKAEAEAEAKAKAEAEAKAKAEAEAKVKEKNSIESNNNSFLPTDESPVSTRVLEDGTKITIKKLPHSSINKYSVFVEKNGKGANIGSCYSTKISEYDVMMGHYDPLYIQKGASTDVMNICDLVGQGSGSGTEAVKQVVEISKALGYEGRVELHAAIISNKGTPVPFYNKLGFRAVRPEVEAEILAGMENLRTTGVYTGPTDTQMYLPLDRIEALLNK